MINSTFFSKPNLLNSYWAGFIAADGCVIDTNGNQKILTIELAIKDYKHLLVFKNTLKVNKKIAIYKNGKSCRVSIGSNKLCEDLYKNFNIVPRKSLTLKPPKNLTNKQALAYIIGYIDGDGSIFYMKRKHFNKIYKYLRLDVIGTKKLLTYIKKYINKDIKILKRPTESNFRLILDGKKAKTVLYSLNKINVPKLTRKWSILK